MTVQLRALNHDTAFEVGIAGVRILLDPWLTESQTDGFAWFSRQFHVLPCTPVQSLDTPDLVLVSLPFTDHCDRDTLCALPGSVPVVGPRSVLRKIGAWGHFEHFEELTPNEEVAFDALRVRYLPPAGRLDLVHAAVWIQGPDASLLYAPHGFDAADPRLEGLQADVVLTTPLRYALPALLGGVVNLGVAAAVALAGQVGAHTLVPCHHEAKRAEGLVARLARVDTAWQDRLHAAMPAGCRVREAPWGQLVDLDGG